MNKSFLKDGKILLLGIYNMLFLLIVISLAIINPTLIIKYWWLILLLALPSFIYQIIRFKKSDEPVPNKYAKLGVLVFFVIFVTIKIF
ncbi:hypothetical protein A9996_01810 [Gelidibacter algens]|jgi:4-hydroxybenzoate polyprenyltransferase|nr:hypothetical protein A9996_01810 [Gelidibacter algens]